jgi:hypothetical protein
MNEATSKTTLHWNQKRIKAVLFVGYALPLKEFHKLYHHGGS